MNYYNEIKEKLIKSEIYDIAKDYSKDRHKVSVYFETGKLLSEAGKEYGKNIIKQYSENLMIEVGKKYNPIFDTFIKKCLLDLIKSSFFMYLVLRT